MTPARLVGVVAVMILGLPGAHPAQAQPAGEPGQEASESASASDAPDPSQPDAASGAGSSDAGPTYRDKKAEKLAAKRQKISPQARSVSRTRWQRALDRRMGKPATPVINIYNTWTHETMVVDAPAPVKPRGGKAAAPPLEVPQERLDRFFRCHFTNQPTSMDPRLFAALIAGARHFGSSRIEIVSGYRAPKYNLILRKKGREVARRSQHTFGHALDFRLAGVGVKRLHAWATGLRLGGVGLYPHSGFIHMDTGRVRYWEGR